MDDLERELALKLLTPDMKRKLVESVTEDVEREVKKTIGSKVVKDFFEALEEENRRELIEVSLDLLKHQRILMESQKRIEEMEKQTVKVKSIQEEIGNAKADIVSLNSKLDALTGELRKFYDLFKESETRKEVINSLEMETLSKINSLLG